MKRPNPLTLALTSAALAGLAAGCGNNEPDSTRQLMDDDTPAAGQQSDAASSPADEGADAAAGAAPTTDESSWITESGLQVEILEEGTGEEVAKAGQTVSVHYTGWLTDGTEFDSSVGGNPYTFPLGGRRVIAGWDEGVAGMKVGEKRKLTIPPDLGYGATGAGGGAIPPNATLVFEVELLNVR
ncbi:hypothetical protein BH23VER1_BH23VER1_36790 [soil metagenome]